VGATRFFGGWSRRLDLAMTASDPPQ